MKKKILGIIPARGGSKGVIRKNIRQVGGNPLIFWAIKGAKESELLSSWVVSTDDDEIKGGMDIDEFAEYFKGVTTPRILLTTNRRPKGKIFDFLKEIKASIPGCEYYERKNFMIKNVIQQAKKEGFTALLLFYEKNGIPRKSILP